MKEKIKQRLRQYFSSVLCLRLTCIVLACRPAAWQGGTFSLFTLHYSLGSPCGGAVPEGD